MLVKYDYNLKVNLKIYIAILDIISSKRVVKLINHGRQTALMQKVVTI